MNSVSLYSVCQFVNQNFQVALALVHKITDNLINFDEMPNYNAISTIPLMRNTDEENKYMRQLYFFNLKKEWRNFWYLFS